jgi:rRNA maturation protein Nop10
MGKLICQKCGSVTTIIDVILEKKGVHLKASCPSCGRFIKFITQSEPSGEDIMPYGKYKGMKVSEIFEEDPSYALWASENLTGRYQKSFEAVKNLIN